MTLVDKLRAMMEAPIRLPGEVDTLDAAIDRIEAVDRVLESMRSPVQQHNLYADALADLRALVREQEGK